MLANIIEQRTQFQIEIAETSAGHDLTTIVDFARSQSAAFASTSFIGYSIGRYYGFAPAFAQISPDPDRAAALLRSYYGKGQPPQEMPPSLPAYASVHDRFHASFQSLIASTLFDDLYLVDHFGRVVYSLQKDSNFTADLTQPRSRDQPLAEVYREVMARLQQTEDPSKILVVSPIKRIEDTYGVLLARPVIQHGSVEGVVAFRLPASALAERLAALQRPGVRIMLLDAKGTPVQATPVADSVREATYGPSILPETGWHYLILADRSALDGGLWLWFLLLCLAGAGGIGASSYLAWRQTEALPRGTGRVILPMLSAATPSQNEIAAAPAALAEPLAGEPEPTVDADYIEPAAPADSLGDEFEASEGYRRSLVEVMTLALDYWQKTKHKGKIELAEESGLWRVYMDRSSLQTRTLDKYLLVETLPRNPRWRDVVRTAEYVLRNAPQPGPERDQLAEALASLKHHLRQVERV
ncbi:MAG TPA: cache domain-containing protein [Aliidongia sp.]|uniref:cache domain-containing protein n=1 Tax=Aliidongia sp. TaxID=1914230 RepID=UPI002DDD18DA|nr:cache domain-containing protein [Aliidongia sp.]HEV2675843.1 cache domain-containing protein [Aliidongia sp.]